MNTLKLEPYLEPKARWTRAGKHILAQYDDETVVVIKRIGPRSGREDVYPVLHVDVRTRLGLSDNPDRSAQPT